MADLTSSITTRMRRTFRYPEEDIGDDNGTRHELDEQEQDNVIRELRKQDEQWNTIYKLVFTILPLACTVAFVPALLGTSTTASQKLLCLLSVASLLATAYAMRHDYTLWTTRRDDKLKNRIHVEGRTLLVSDYVVWSNIAVCIFLAVMSFLARRISDTDGGALWILYLTPGVVLGIVTIVGKESSSVNIGELERLRYEYKGA